MPNLFFLALSVFAVTLILIFWRPRGIKEVWFAAAGALLVRLLGLVDAADVSTLMHETGGVMLFLAGLLVIAFLTDRAGVFERLARFVGRAAKGDGRRLFAGVYLIGLLVTVWLSLDTTAVILAPIVYNLARLLGVPPLPLVFATTYVANTASLFLPLSNLTNLIVWGRLEIPFWEFARVMFLPSVLAVAVNLASLMWLFRTQIPKRYEAKETATVLASAAVAEGEGTPTPFPQEDVLRETAGEPGGALPEPRQAERFLVTVWGLGLVLCALLLAPIWEIELWAVACAGATLLAAYHLLRGGLVARELIQSISWDLLPFVFSLFMILRAVAKSGLSEWAVQAVVSSASGQGFWELLIIAATTALGSNLINNLPMILIATESLAHPVASGELDIASLYAALIGTNLGPNLTVIGSLATMLSLSIIGKKGLNVPSLLYLKVGLISVPLILIAAVFGLWLTL